MNRSASFVSRRLRVFEDAYLAPLALSGDLAVSVAEELLPLPPPRKRELARMAVEQGWDRAELRSWMRREAPADGSRRRTVARHGHGGRSLLAQARQFRDTLVEADATQLTDSERTALRAVFRELAMLARAPSDKQPLVFPPLPAAHDRRRG